MFQLTFHLIQEYEVPLTVVKEEKEIEIFSDYEEVLSSNLSEDKNLICNQDEYIAQNMVR